MSAVYGPSPFYLGIDLGGTNIKSGVVNDDGRCSPRSASKPQADRGPVVGLENLAEAGRRAVESSGLTWDQIAGIGLGSPGTMDLVAGLLLDPPNLPGWDNLPIRQLLGDRLRSRRSSRTMGMPRPTASTGRVPVMELKAWSCSRSEPGSAAGS